MARIFLLMLMLLPLAACVSMPKYVPMDSKSPVDEVTARSVVWQDEILVSAEESGEPLGGQNGLLGVLIESGFAKTRRDETQKIVEPVYPAIDDVDFRKDYWAALTAVLRGPYQIKVADFKTTPLKLTWDERNKLPASLAPGKAYMHIDTSYTFTQDFSRINLITTIDVWKGGVKEQLYANNFYYQSNSVGAEKADAIKLWSNDGGKLYREAIKEGIAETMKMFTLDMEHPRYTEPGKASVVDAKAVTMKKFGAYNQTIEGPVLSEQPSRVVVRHTDGRLYSLAR